MLHVVMFVVYVVFVVIPLLYVFLDVLLVQETIKAFEFEFEFAKRNSYIFIQENASENVVCEMA